MEETINRLLGIIYRTGVRPDFYLVHPETHRDLRMHEHHDRVNIAVTWQIVQLFGIICVVTSDVPRGDPIPVVKVS